MVHRVGYCLAQLSSELGCSDRCLYEVFTRDIGLKPRQWLHAQRMVVARRFLLGGWSIEAVSKVVGYRSVVAFIRRFQQTHGLTPGRYVRIRAGKVKLPIKPERKFIDGE